jgi:hypothetical protein
MKYVFNPFTGNFDQVIEPLTRQEVIKSIAIEIDDSVIPLGTADILFDEDSILYQDDDYFV